MLSSGSAMYSGEMPHNNLLQVKKCSRQWGSLSTRILIFFFFLCTNSFGQVNDNYKKDSIKREVNYTPYNRKGNYQTWAIKGKPLAWIIGNGWGACGLLGVEYSVFKNHSIGIDGYFEFDTDGNDQNNTTYHSIQKALFVNYRYYLPFKNLRENKSLFFYTGLFARYGQLTDTYDKNYRGGNDSLLVSTIKNFNSVGVLTGVLTNFGGGDRLGLDFNIGWLLNNKSYINKYANQSNTTTALHYTTFDMRVGLNLYWWFYRQK